MIFGGPIELSGSDQALFTLVVLGVPAIGLGLIALFVWLIASEVRASRRRKRG